jgi:hypothetical protein
MSTTHSPLSHAFMSDNHTRAPIMFRTIRWRRRLPSHKFRKPNLLTGVLRAQFTQLRGIKGDDDDEEPDDEDGARNADSESDFDARGEFAAVQAVRRRLCGRGCGYGERECARDL